MLPIIVALGVSTSLSEGVGISLFMPLLQGINSTQVNLFKEEGFSQWLYAWHHLLPIEYRYHILLLLIFGIVLLKALLSYLNTVIFTGYKSKIGHELRTRIFSNLIWARYDLLEQYESGKLLNTLATETWRACEALAILVDLMINLCTITILFILLLLLSWKLTAIVGLTLSFSFLSMRWVSNRAKMLSQIAVQANQLLAERMWEGVSALKEIRLYGCETHEQRAFEQASERVRKTFFWIDLLTQSVKPVTEIFSVLLLLGVLSLALLQRQLSLATALTFMFVLYRLHPHVKQLDSERLGLATLTGSVEDVMTLFHLPQTALVSQGTMTFHQLCQQIDFKEVSFQYVQGDKAALKQVSFRIPQGKTTAIVGPSGAGKTTLLKLLGRLYEPTQGVLGIDGVALEHLNRKDWVQRVAIVSQDGYIFNKTVRENITYGYPGATEAEIIHAATLADAHPFICDLPNGYDTFIGGRGAYLSGGQQQRIILARAIVRNPQILILDEATNALDSISEDLIQRALCQLSQNRTVIIIAHRLSTIEHADQILVLDKGQLVEQGTLTQLLDYPPGARGLFAQLYQLQNRASPSPAAIAPPAPRKTSASLDDTVPQMT
jgi:subfamily B ATP-binding cassette protein MsbA